MANFTTHIAVGTLVSGALATLTLAADVVAPENLVAVTLAGVVGSVLPDIDLKESRPSQAMFSGLAIFFSFVVLFSFATRLSIAELWIVWLGTLLGVRYGLQALFHRFSAHRGIWHSILAACFAAVATAVIFKHVFDRHEGVAWLGAGFMLVGFLTHLILDEIYSVDVMDTRIKASFGTALKLFDAKNPGDSAILAVLTVMVFLATPSTKTFVDGISSRDLWAGLQQRLLPQQKWFGLIDMPVRGRLADGAQRAPVSTSQTGVATGAPPRPDGASDLTTGSLPDRR